MTSSNRAIVGMLVVTVLAIAFWVLVLSPKRDELKKLDAQAADLRVSLAQHEAEVTEAEAGRCTVHPLHITGFDADMQLV